MPYQKEDSRMNRDNDHHMVRTNESPANSANAYGSNDNSGIMRTHHPRRARDVSNLVMALQSHHSQQTVPSMSSLFGRAAARGVVDDDTDFDSSFINEQRNSLLPCLEPIRRPSTPFPRATGDGEEEEDNDEDNVADGGREGVVFEEGAEDLSGEDDHNSPVDEILQILDEAEKVVATEHPWEDDLHYPVDPILAILAEAEKVVSADFEFHQASSNGKQK